MVEVQAKEYMKEQIEDYLKHQIGEPLTQVKEDELIAKRNEFVDWLTMNHLSYLLDFDSEKTTFEWEVTTDILNLLMKFDSLIEQHDLQFGKPIDKINEDLRNSVKKFSRDY